MTVTDQEIRKAIEKNAVAGMLYWCHWPKMRLIEHPHAVGTLHRRWCRGSGECRGPGRVPPQGIGSAITLAALETARHQGCRLGVLFSSLMAASMYEGLGFRRYGTGHCYLWSPEGAGS